MKVLYDQITLSAIYLILWSTFVKVICNKFDLRSRYPIPKFLKSKTNVTAFVGETAVFVCTVENLGTRKVVWRKTSDVSPLTIGEFPFVHDSSISVEHRRESQDWKLIISGVHSNHSGEYECQVSSQDKTLRKFFYLTVIEGQSEQAMDARSSKETITIYGQRHVEKGLPFEIHCKAKVVDFPPENIDWFKDGIIIDTDFQRGIFIQESVSLKKKIIESTFHKARAELQDSGSYTCRVSHELVKSTAVTVLYTIKNNNKREDSTQKGHVAGNRAAPIGNLNPLVHLSFTLFILLRLL